MSLKSASGLYKSQNVDYFKTQQHLNQKIIENYATSVHTFVMNEVRTRDTPGADAYDVAPAVCVVDESPPAFTIKQRYEQKMEYAPGYEHNEYASSLRQSGGKLPSAARMQPNANDIPAPNHYKTYSAFNKQTGSHFPAALPPEPRINQNPAPNYYNPYSKGLDVLTSAFSIRDRPHTAESSSDAKFYLSHERMQARSRTFGRQSCCQVIERTPGPLDYAERGAAQTTRKYQILRKTREEKSDSSPAPCDYSSQISSLKKSGAGKFGSRCSSARPASSVGPGQYELSRQHHIKGGSIGKESRGYKLGLYNLGPGSYDLAQAKKPREFHIMNKYQRAPAVSDEPGPNSYTLSGSIASRDANIASKYSSGGWIPVSDVPGAAQYDVRPIKPRKEIMHETFSRSRKILESSDSPAPNEYDVSESMKNGGFSMRFRSYGLTL